MFACTLRRVCKSRAKCTVVIWIFHRSFTCIFNYACLCCVLGLSEISVNLTDNVLAENNQHLLCFFFFFLILVCNLTTTVQIKPGSSWSKLVNNVPLGWACILLHGHAYLHCFGHSLWIKPCRTPWLVDYVQCLHAIGQTTFHSLASARILLCSC